MSKPWMPLYIGDYLRDTRHLGATEHGVYLLLMMAYWTAGCLPNDDEKLARIACISRAQWMKIRGTIQTFFQDGWKHQRIDQELAKAEDISTKRRDAVNKRKDRHPINDRTNVPTNVGDLNTQSQPQSQPQERNKQESAPASADALEILLGEDQVEGHLEKPSLGKKASKGTRLSETWTLPPEWVEDGLNEGLSVYDIERDAKKFKNYWLGKPGAGGIKLDWHATWRNWVISSAERLGKKPPNRPTTPAAPPPGRVFVKEGTPQYAAWRAHWIAESGRPPPLDTNLGGWYFASEWPPEKSLPL